MLNANLPAHERSAVAMAWGSRMAWQRKTAQLGAPQLGLRAKPLCFASSGTLAGVWEGPENNEVTDE